ncbi:hypothetical protein DESC_780473 [Desulfosarcina cetonica]|nr:hypothetical protein DESC_780473 [Desulfosarcina cetonica]
MRQRCPSVLRGGSSDRLADEMGHGPIESQAHGRPHMPVLAVIGRFDHDQLAIRLGDFQLGTRPEKVVAGHLSAGDKIGGLVPGQQTNGLRPDHEGVLFVRRQYQGLRGAGRNREMRNREAAGIRVAPDIEEIDITHEAGHEAAFGMIVDCLGRSDLLEPTGPQDGDAVGHHHGLFQGMGDVDEGLARAKMQGFEFLFQGFAKTIVQCRERLVEKENLRVEGQGTRQGDALALAAGTLTDAFIKVAFGQAEHGQQFQRPGLAFGGRHAFDLEGKLDILPHAAVGKKRQGLEHHAGGTLVGRHPVQADVAQPDGALGLLFHADQQFDQRGLAAPGRTHDGEKFALADLEVNVLEGDKAAVFLT